MNTSTACTTTNSVIGKECSRYDVKVLGLGTGFMKSIDDMETLLKCPICFKQFGSYEPEREMFNMFLESSYQWDVKIAMCAGCTQNFCCGCLAKSLEVDHRCPLCRKAEGYTINRSNHQIKTRLVYYHPSPVLIITTIVSVFCHFCHFCHLCLHVDYWSNCH